MAANDYLLKDAEISADQVYRFMLLRVWDESLPRCVFVCLNPSTADSCEDDPTVRRCVQYAKDWGCGSLVIVNYSPFRATEPKDMWAHDLPIDVWVQNMAVTHRELDEAAIAILAWGEGPSDKDLAEYLERHPKLCCLTVNKSGQPGHPLYLRKSLLPKSHAQLIEQRDGRLCEREAIDGGD